MKKLISIVLAVMLVVSVAVVSVNAYGSNGDYSKMSSGDGYNPSDSYTVDENTPYAEDAIKACGGNLSEAQTIYFQAPLNDGEHDVWENKYNTFPGPDLSTGEPYMHVCIYWWSGIAGDSDHGWPSGKGCTWVGYQAHLIDKENRIYSAQVPGDGGTPLVVWNNGVNAGMDKTAAIFQYGRQIMDANIEGAYEGDYDPYLPEGTPNEDNMDGCIQIIDYSVSEPNALTGFPSYGSNWFIYYGKGCYGDYAPTSDNFESKYANCQNPEHLADPDKYHPIQGDVNGDKLCNIEDVLCIQQYLAGLDPDPFNENAADVDEDGYISIIDATRIQRYLAHICNIDGSKPYKES